MGNASDRFEMRRIAPGTADYHLALHRVLNLKPPPLGAEPEPQVTNLLANARRGTVSIDLLLGAYQADELVTASLAVEYPGATAMVFVSSDLQPKIKYRATVVALQALQTVAWQRSIALLEVLAAPESGLVRGVLGEAGFRHLTRLRYLKRPGIHATRLSQSASDLKWAQYTPDREPLFQAAVERTYVQTQDCPELTDLRRTADVLAGYRAAGVFDPALWWVAMRGQEPVGVILLNRTAPGPVLEVVYMGVAQPSRGQGVADALLWRAVEAAAEIGDMALALAVDQRNIPAQRLYARWDFVETEMRDAWIASPVQI